MMKTFVLFAMLIAFFSVTVYGFAATLTASSGKTPAMLCSSCGFGNQGKSCVKCGNPFGSVPAKLCSSCGFGNQANACVKCGQFY